MKWSLAGIVKAAEIAFQSASELVARFIDSIGAVGRVLGIVNAQGKTDAQVKEEQAKKTKALADSNKELLEINKQLNAPPMTKAAKEKIDMAKKQAETIKGLIEIRRKELSVGGQWGKEEQLALDNYAASKPYKNNKIQNPE